MLFTLIKKEIISHLLSLRFVVTFAVMLPLVFGSLYLTSNKYIEQRNDFGTRERVNRENLAEMLADDDKNLTFPPDSYHFLSYIDSVGLTSSGRSGAPT
jgi:ABC-type Na+ efflux pump permease subunit